MGVGMHFDDERARVCLEVLRDCSEKCYSKRTLANVVCRFRVYCLRRV
jgi:hypothetical protein